MSNKLIHLISFILVLIIALSSTTNAVGENLVAWWKLDDEGTGTVIDSSGNGHHGTLVGDAHFVPGLFGEALELDGDGDYVVIDGYKGIVGDGTNTPAFSITVWVRKEGPVGGDGEIIGWGSTGAGNRMEFRFNADNNRVRIECGGGNAQNDTELTTGQWHHVAMTVLENSTYESGVTFYLDGHDNTRANADPDPTHPTENFDVKIGLRYNEDNRLYTGLIDDLRIYDKVLTITEVRDIIKLGYLASSHSPDPPDGSNYTDTWATLQWTPGGQSVSHDLYFGTSFEDVNAGAEKAFVGNMTVNNQPIGFTGFPAPEGLVSGSTYYWRVDEVNDAHPDSPWRGEVWSFRVPSITAYNPVPADGEPFEDPNVVLSWSPGINATLHAVYFGTDGGEVDNATGAPPHIGSTFEPGLLTGETTYYWRVDTFNGAEWIKGPLWSFSTRPEIPLASDPNLILLYKFNEGAGTNALDWSGHDNHGKLMGNPQWVAGYDGSALKLGSGNYVAIQNLHYDNASEIPGVTVSAWIRTNSGANQIIASYDRNEYWRLQINGEVATDGQVGWHVWTSDGQNDYGSFTRVDDGFWHHVCGVFDRGWSTIYIDGKPEPSSKLGSGFGRGRDIRYGYVGLGSESTSFNAVPRTPADYFDGDLDEIRIYDRALTQEEIVEVMRVNPLMAWDLQPPSRTFDIESVPSSLTWKPGDMASQHDIFFGTDGEAVNNADASDTTGVYGGRQAGTTYVPPEGFAWDTTYYWRIDEFNTDGTITKGNIRAIIVADFITIDDFEAYDVGNNEIWWSWKDGLGCAAHGNEPAYPGNGTGSAVGWDDTPSYTEETIVHGGRQAMPLSYDNSILRYSEVEMTLTLRRDWVKYGTTELSIWFHGDPNNSAESMYVALNGSAVVTHDNPNAALVEEWNEWIINLQAFADQGVNLANVNTIALGLGNKQNPQPGGSGTMYFDDIRLYQPPPPPEPVTVENFSFELPGTEKQLGFDNVPGWNTDGPCADSGVETGYTPTDGDWTAYLMSGDPSVWQLTDRTIAEGDVLEMKVDARITWAATTLQMTLYYDDNGTRVPVTTNEVTLTDDMQEYTLSFAANDVPESVGHQLGIEFTNVSSGDSWIGLDNVRLEASTE